jgi:hypothetical protein
MCTRVGNQWSRGVVTARVRTDTVQSLRHQRRDLHQSTYPVPLGRSGLILLSVSAGEAGQVEQAARTNKRLGWSGLAAGHTGKKEKRGRGWAGGAKIG